MNAPIGSISSLDLLRRVCKHWQDSCLLELRHLFTNQHFVEMIVSWSGATFNSSAVNIVSSAGSPNVMCWILCAAVLNTLTMGKFGGRDDGAGQPPKMWDLYKKVVRSLKCAKSCIIKLHLCNIHFLKPFQNQHLQGGLTSRSWSSVFHNNFVGLGKFIFAHFCSMELVSAPIFFVNRALNKNKWLTNFVVTPEPGSMMCVVWRTRIAKRVNLCSPQTRSSENFGIAVAWQR